MSETSPRGGFSKAVTLFLILAIVGAAGFLVQQGIHSSLSGYATAENSGQQAFGVITLIILGISGALLVIEKKRHRPITFFDGALPPIDPNILKYKNEELYNRHHDRFNDRALLSDERPSETLVEEEIQKESNSNSDNIPQ